MELTGEKKKTKDICGINMERFLCAQIIHASALLIA